MGQESSKSKTNMSGRNHQSSVGESPRRTSPLSSMNRQMEGTSVDGSISSQVGEVKSEDSQQFPSELSDTDVQLKNTIVNKYLNLKGEIDEVKSLNSEVMEKISLLEKRAEEKKKQRALNRMQTARFRERVPNGYVQTDTDITNEKSEETAIAETESVGMSVISPSVGNESPRIDHDHIEAPNPTAASGDKTEDASSANPRLKGTQSDCVVTAEQNVVNEIACEEVKDLFVNSSKIDLSAGGYAATKDSEAEKVFENANTEKDRPATVIKVVSDHQLIDERRSDTNPVIDSHYTKNVDGENPVKTEACVGKSKQTETVEVIAENSEPVSDGKSGSKRVSMESVDETEIIVDSEKSEKIPDTENANETLMKGFTETFELTVPQREYNLMLKRTKTDEKQDNRLAYEFDLHPNAGCVYTGLGPLENPIESVASLSATGTNVKHVSYDDDRNRKVETNEQQEAQEKASKPFKDQKLSGIGRTVKTSVWKTAPMQKATMHDTDRKPKETDTETSGKVIVAKLDKSCDLNTVIQTAQTPSTADQVPKKTNTQDERSGDKATKDTDGNADVVMQEQKLPGARIPASDLSEAVTPLAAHLMKQWAPGLEKMGLSVKTDGGKITVGQVEWKFDARFGKMKVLNADEVKETLREAQSELEELEADMGEEELNQFKFSMGMLKLMSSMCSDEGVDLIESVKFLGSLGATENMNLKEILGEENAGHMQKLLTATTQMVKVLEPQLPAAGELALEAKGQPVLSGAAALRPTVQSTATKLAGNLPNTQSQQPETVKDAEAATPASKEGKTVRPGHQSDEEEQEVILVEESQWIDAANLELEKGRRCRDIREKGMDTIICLDVSSSMRGEAWNQALGFIKGFIECIQGTTLSDGCFEHVALVTYGSETKVQQHMTCDYVEVMRKLERLKPGGPSPMLAGMFMTLAAIKGAGSVFQVGGYRIHPRIFLITDGKATPGGMISGPDHCSADEMDIVFSPILSLVDTIYSEHHCTVNPVPVGSFDLTLLDTLANHTKGKITSPEDYKRVSRTMENLILAAKVGSQEGLIGIPAMLPMLLPALADHELTAEDHAEISEFLKTHEKNESSDDDDPADTNLPPLGSRVRRTENLKGTDDAYNLGTVTKRFKDGYLGVTWDKTPPGVEEHEKILFSSSGGRNKVKITEDFRILRDELIAVGCMIKRGRDWRYGHQDGGDGNLGMVYDVNSRGIVKVRWRNGAKNTYRFGCEGKFDLEVVSPTESGNGNVFSDPSVGGAVGWTHRSPSDFLLDDDDITGNDRLAELYGNPLLDSDEEKDSDVSDSSDDSDMTLEEKMNRRNKQMSKSMYIIEPLTSENALDDSESEKTIENTSTGDIVHTEVAIGDMNPDDKLLNSERDADMPPDSFSSASQNEKNSSDSVKTTGRIECVAPEVGTALSNSSPGKHQKDLDKYGAKPKQLGVQLGNPEMPSSAENNSAAALAIEGEAENHLPEVRALKEFAPDQESQKEAVSRVDEISAHLQQDNIGKQTGQRLCGNNSAEQELTNENLKLLLPSNTVNQQTKASTKTSINLLSNKTDKVCVDNAISQTSTTTTWCWQDSGEWQPYPSNICDKIEKSFNLKKPSVLIQVNGKAYRVVFSRMEQVDINTRTAIKVQRQGK